MRAILPSIPEDGSAPPRPTTAPPAADGPAASAHSSGTQLRQAPLPAAPLQQGQAQQRAAELVQAPQEEEEHVLPVVADSGAAPSLYLEQPGPVGLAGTGLVPQAGIGSLQSQAWPSTHYPRVVVQSAGSGAGGGKAAAAAAAGACGSAAAPYRVRG